MARASLMAFKCPRSAKEGSSQRRTRPSERWDAMRTVALFGSTVAIIFRIPFRSCKQAASKCYVEWLVQGLAG